MTKRMAKFSQSQKDVAATTKQPEVAEAIKLESHETVTVLQNENAKADALNVFEQVQESEDESSSVSSQGSFSDGTVNAL